MKQLGNLAIVCAQRPGILLQILDGKVTLHVGAGTNRRSYTAGWNDDAAISRLIHELNFGDLSEKEVNHDSKH